MRTSFRIAILGFFLASFVGAQVWTEIDDAPSFPDGEAQWTFGDWAIQRIEGTLDYISYDERDAYCIRIVDPAAFLATTHPDLHPEASASFDSRLFLFTPDGAPVLGNDEAIDDELGLSVLRATATDGSGFVLQRPGEYVLVVATEPDEPWDKAEFGLFGVSNDRFAIHAAKPIAGSFMHWSHFTVGAPSGPYSVALEGVETCGVVDMVVATIERDQVCIADELGGFSGCSDVSAEEGFSFKPALGDLDGDGALDAVFAMSLFEPNRACLGDGIGGFSGCSAVSSDAFDSSGVALADLDKDGDLDAVFANYGDPSRVCLGNGSGGFSGCANASDSMNQADAVALGDLDGDGRQDMVLAISGVPNQACVGDGAGGFGSCVEVSADANSSFRLALGHIDGDGLLDAVFANMDEADRVCFGDGSGGFASCSDVGASTVSSHGVALSDVNGDLAKDAVFAVVGSSNRVCLGDGSGGFSCGDIGPDTESAFDVALGHVDEDGNVDALFGRTHGPERVCLGDGTGAFSCADVSAASMLAAGVAAGRLDLRLRKIFNDDLETGDTSIWSVTVE